MIEILSTSLLKLGWGAGFTAAVLDPKTPKLNPGAIGIKVTNEGKVATVPYLESLRELLMPLGATVAIVEIDRLLAMMEKDECDVGTLHEKHKSIFSRIEDQLVGTHFLYIEQRHRQYFDNASAWFGEQCESVFIRSKEDIEEAGKCLALGRSTACVFHLMRAMEAAVQVLCQKLGIENTERQWGSLLSDMDKEIQKMPKNDARKAWSLARANLFHVKEAWRNEVMHPKETYTEAQAQEVFESTRVFMTHLVSLA